MRSEPQKSPNLRNPQLGNIIYSRYSYPVLAQRNPSKEGVNTGGRLPVLKNPPHKGVCYSPAISRCVFQYIGSLDVPRPNSRVEIVAAMRRIRVSSEQLSPRRVKACTPHGDSVAICCSTSPPALPIWSSNLSPIRFATSFSRNSQGILA